MGRIAINVEGFPPSRRGVRFNAPENTRLVQEVRQRKEVIYGSKNQSPQPQQVRQAWEEIAEIISSVSDIKRSADQCRKRFNDIKRRGQMMVAGRKRGRPPKSRPKDDVLSMLESNQHAEPEDFEFEIQAPMDDDPDYEPVPKKREMVKMVIPKEVTVPAAPPKVDQVSPKPPVKPLVKPPVKPPATPSHTTTPSHTVTPPQTVTPSPSLPKPKCTVVRKPVGSINATVKPRLEQEQEDEKHPFLELQKAGFDMLKRELSLFRDSVMSLNTRLNHLEVALRPVGYIADSLSRIASAVERLTCPPE